jgi:hypothetical protein
VKKIIKPAEKEESAYFSDFSGKCFGNFPPDVNVKIEFNYNSRFDGDVVELHLTDEESILLLDLIKHKASTDYKNSVKTKLICSEQQYDNSIDSRDWNGCDCICNSIELQKYILDIKED